MKKSKQLEKQKCKLLMQKSVMDIWTTLILLRRSNNSHACNQKESIALCVFGGSKIPWQLWVLGWAAPRSTVSWADLCHPHAAASQGVSAFFYLWFPSIRASRQLESVMMLQWWYSERDMLALKVIEFSFLCESLIPDRDDSSVSTHSDSKVKKWRVIYP